MSESMLTVQLTKEAVSLIDMQLFKASVDIGNTLSLSDKLLTIRLDIEHQIEQQGVTSEDLKRA